MMSSVSSNIDWCFIHSIMDPQIIDFGLAITKSISKASGYGVKAAGTLSYQPPENFTPPNFEGNHTVDVYAYGITVNEMYAQAAPFEELNEERLKDLIKNFTVQIQK